MGQPFHEILAAYCETAAALLFVSAVVVVVRVCAVVVVTTATGDHGYGSSGEHKAQQKGERLLHLQLHANSGVTAIQSDKLTLENRASNNNTESTKLNAAAVLH